MWTKVTESWDSCVTFHCTQRLGVLLLHSGIRNQEEIGLSSLDICSGTWHGHWYDFAKDTNLLGHDSVSLGECVVCFQ